MGNGPRPSRAIEFIGRLIIAALCIASSPNVGEAKFAVTTYHYDNLRTGWNSLEKTLTASRFPHRFGVLATVPLDDQVDAQPLFVPDLIIAGTTHDVVYVATESNSIYAIDALSGKILVQTNLGPPAPEQLGCGNNGPNLGILGTPVIDLKAKLLFVVAYTNLPSSGPTYQLHRLNLLTLRDTLPPVTIAASHTLVDGSTYTFNAAYQRQRPGLLELNLPTGNVVYVGFGSFCDYDSQYSRGWVLGWAASNLAPLLANQLNDTQTAANVVAHGYPDPPNPPMFLTSVWMSGFGIASDGTSLYFATGNSDCNWTVQGDPCPASTTWDGATHIQESVVQLSSGLALGGIFTPSNMPFLDHWDTDLGSGGVMLFSTGDATHPYLAVAGGKDGRVFLLDPANLGKPTGGSPPTSPPPLNTQSIDACWCGPSVFEGSDGIKRVVTSHGSTLRTYQVQMSPSPTLAPEATATISSGQDGGFFTSVSSNGAAAGSAIIWAVGRPTGSPFAINLYAFAATPSAGSNTLTQLFSAPAGAWPNTGGNANIVPVVAHGKVYVASAYLDGSGKTLGQLNIFGERGIGIPIVSAAARLAAGPHVISGTLVTVNGSLLTFRTRAGKTATIDASGAFRNDRVTGPLKVGGAYTAHGTTFDTTGTLLSTAIGRAKSSEDLWPPDH